jgi:phospholipid/cholesterol/gamma-HCH transport system permease protein
MAVATEAPKRAVVPPRLRERIGWPKPLVDVGGTVHLTGQALMRLAVPPYTWRKEFIDQSNVLVRRCFFPTLIANFFFAFAIDPPAGQIVQLLGSVDRLGSFYVNAAIREFGPFITAMMIAGVGGCAVTADLGARKVREEISAMESLAMDPVKELVAPRFLTIIYVTLVMTVFGAVMGIIGGAVGVLMFGEPLAGFLATFSSNFTIYDLVAMPIKVTLFGLLIASTSCYMGLNVSGGSEGVGRAVNRAVVVAFLGIWAVDFTFSAVLLAAFPQVSTLR